MAIRTKTPKQITYKLLTALELAKELDRVGCDVEIRFTTENMMQKNFWEKPKQLHCIKRTQKWGGDDLIAQKMHGGGTMIRSTANYIAPWEESDPQARAYGLVKFTSEYLLEFGSGAQRVAVQFVTA
jgi:hypothetical protein